jgi:hypothetical protein
VAESAEAIATVVRTHATGADATERQPFLTSARTNYSSRRSA